MHFLNRRDFLRDSAAAAAALAGTAAALGPLEAAEEKPAKRGSANDRLRVAVIGVRGQGGGHVAAYSRNARKYNCEVAVVCDVDRAVVGPRLKTAEQAQGTAPRYEQDLRRVMDDKSIDLVSIATPNHWHALAAIWALQAGKHVYVEKPVSHNVSEGRRIVEAARRYNRICQTGTQSRSNAGMRDAIAYVQSGQIGKVSLARGLCYKLRPSIGKVSGPQQPPKSMDYDLWCGPAPYQLPHRNGAFGPVHYDWHWVWDYGNGDLGNQGIHEMDKARWGLGKDTLPRSVLSLGGRFGYQDDGETPNTQICVFDYGDCELIFEVRGLPSPKLRGAGVGNIFYGSEGYVVCPTYDSGIAYNLKGEEVKRWKAGGDHFGNFIQAVREGRREVLNADILEGHLSSALCHLGNISYRLGTPQPFSPRTKAFGDDKEAYETLVRMEDHLKENKVPLDRTECTVGRKLQLDQAAEKFVNDPEADRLLTREYRKGFEVPAKI